VLRENNNLHANETIILHIYRPSEVLYLPSVIITLPLAERMTHLEISPHTIKANNPYISPGVIPRLVYDIQLPTEADAVPCDVIIKAIGNGKIT
jgi:hypothetical protein